MKTIQVFGVSNEQVASYIERKEVDLRFKEGMQRNKHIVVFGASKQGKTALTNKHLNETNYLRVNCAPQTQPIDIYKSILRQVGIDFVEEWTELAGSSIGIKGELKAQVKIPLVGLGEGSGELSGEKKDEKNITHKTVEYNLALPQDISEILKSISFRRRIILENFHYLGEEVQKILAFHLRVFEDSNILFIVLGIWREKNRLAQFNGDLQDRIIEIPVEPWERNDFRLVADKGGKLLNVSFNKILNKLIENSFDSIGVFQELCKESCLAAGVSEKIFSLKELTEDHLTAAIKKKLEDYKGRHIRSIETFIEQKAKGSDKVPLYLGYYFISVLLRLDFSVIEKGLRRKDIHSKIRDIHHRPDDVRPSDMSSFLHNIVSSQINKNIIPPLFDYDRSTRTLKIIDSTLYFFLRNIDVDELISEFESPI